jgi:superfamily II DNA or RNA helicase
LTDLRPFQTDALQQALGEIERGLNPLIVCPTGGGKTVIGNALIAALADKHVLWLTHRRELVFQPRQKLLEGFGIEAGVILSGEQMKQMQRVQIASVQTFHARYIRGGKDLPPADLIVIDEAHHIRARTYLEICDRYPDARKIGLTATPCRTDGRGLGSTFSVIVETPQVEELINLGFLVRTRIWAPSKPDLMGVRTQSGDYVIADLAERVDRAELVGDIVTHWHRHAGGRSTIVYATTVAHSQHLADEFARSGVKVAHLDGKTPKEQRDEILKQLANGDVTVVCNCQVLTEGFDAPDVGCIVLARPTKSMGLYRQMIGRGLRPAPGKGDCIVLDHSGATDRHGRVEDAVWWTLQEDQKARTAARAGECGADHERKLLTCTECHAICVAGKPCPECGHLPKRPGQHLDILDGDLVLYGTGPHRSSEEQRSEWHQQLLGIAQERGYKSGWVAHKFKEKFGHWPTRLYVKPMKPSAEVLSWVRSRNIAWAKARERANA